MRDKPKFNWRVTLYDVEDSMLTSWIIRDSTEFEAMNAAMSDSFMLNPKLWDWSLKQI